jgi:endoglucanase
MLKVSFYSANSDVYLGYVGWAAGNFLTNYVLSETPTNQGNGVWVDEPLVTACLVR